MTWERIHWIQSNSRATALAEAIRSSSSRGSTPLAQAASTSNLISTSDKLTVIGMCWDWWGGEGRGDAGVGDHASMPQSIAYLALSDKITLTNVTRGISLMLVEANVEGCAFQLSLGLASRGDKLLVKLMTVAGGLKSISDTKIGVWG